MTKRFLPALLLAFLLCPAVAATDYTKTFGVYRQRAQDAQLWASRGCNLAICYEPQDVTPGHPSVTQAQWRAAWKAAGCQYIAEPIDATNLAAENTDPGVLAILNPVQEIDNYVVQVNDNNLVNFATGEKIPDAARLAAVEKVYTDAEAFYAKAKREAPNKPVAMLFALVQLPYMKADYARLNKCYDIGICDYYWKHRGGTVATYSGLIDKFRAIPGGDKLKIGINECSRQHLNPVYYPAEALITPDEFLATCMMERTRGIGSALFPQQMGEDHQVPFLWDAMPDNLVTVWKQFAGKVTPNDVPATKPATQPGGAPFATFRLGDGREFEVRQVK